MSDIGVDTPPVATRPATSPQPILSLQNISQVFVAKGRRVHAVQDVSLDVQDGEFVSIVGPSGCGKSTLLNIIVGLIQPSRGRVLFKGERLSGINQRIGYVTQADNLFPWRTLRGNVEFALEARKVSRSERRQRAEHLIRRVGLKGFEESYPYELSGGMRQRANIIRTLVYNPEVILMDEPFGPLDAQTRLVLQNQMLQLWSEARKTIIFITHDLAEAIALSDRVLVMTARPGQIKTITKVPLSRPRDLFHIHDEAGFRETYHLLWSSLEEEVRKASAEWLGEA